MGGAASVVIVGVVAVTVLNSLRTPVTIAEEYLDSLARGDAPRAAQIVDPGVPNDQRALLTQEALAAADHRIEVENVKVVEGGGEPHAVEATYRIDGERFTQTLTVAPGPKEFLFLNTWRLTQPLLAQVEIVLPEGDTALAGDLPVTLPPSESSSGDEEHRALFPVYPGVYTFTAPESVYFAAEAVTVVATPGSAPIATLALTPTEELEQIVLTVVQEQVVACAGVPTNLDDVCPYGVQSKTLESLTVTSQPSSVEIDSSGHFRAGEAKITVQPQASFGWTPSPRTYTFSLRGEVVLDSSGTPEVQFDKDTGYGW